jgi:hypothetical protein
MADVAMRPKAPTHVAGDAGPIQVPDGLVLSKHACHISFETAFKFSAHLYPSPPARPAIPPKRLKVLVLALALAGGVNCSRFTLAFRFSLSKGGRGISCILQPDMDLV